MPAWPDDPSWRQGHVIPDEAAIRLGLVTSGTNEIALVIAHDCDLAQVVDIEPDVEVILGRRIDAPDGNNLHTKNARRLHLPITQNNVTMHLDLLATKKLLIHKEQLSDVLPDATFKLESVNLEQLQRWLAARYRRAAFPNGFEARMKDRDVNTRIAKLMRRWGQCILGLYFDVDDGNDVVKSGPDDVYELKVVIIYFGGNDPDNAKDEAERTSGEISKLFIDKCQEDKQWRDIELVGCEVISADAISLSLFRRLREWRLEYISLAEDPPGNSASD